MGLFSAKLLEEADSPVNGKITVLKSFGFGVYIQVGGLTQSGGIVYDVWKQSLGKARKLKNDVSDALILGLGGGTNAQVIREFWPKARVTGVDIDPVMVEMGKKYLGLREVKTIIKDAFDLTAGEIKTANKYDLILVDTYLGDAFPEKFESDEFLKRVGKLLAPEGIVIFNRLYYDEKRPLAMKFGTKLEKFFSKVDYVFPEANLMLLCYNDTA
jgi:spermidine synthase